MKCLKKSHYMVSVWDDNILFPKVRKSTLFDGVVEKCSEVFNHFGSTML